MRFAKIVISEVQRNRCFEVLNLAGKRIIFVPQKIKKAGRPKLPKGEAKTEMIRARVTPSEYRAVEEAAKATGKDVSEWAREIMLSRAV
jgi:hypothetical protein